MNTSTGISEKSFVLGVKYLLLLFLIIACGQDKESASGVTPVAIGYKIRNSWPHDTASFTQGLVIHEGRLYESTGQKKSWIGIVDIKSGMADKKVVLNDKYFGEGITILNNKVYQLTWQNRTGFIYDLKTFQKIGDFTYSTEGWGITHDSTNLIMSDGTDKLVYLDTATLKPVKTIHVKDETGAAEKLNELEYVNGFILANKWETGMILKIDPNTGNVVGRLDLTPLLRNARALNPKIDVLNGIAYHRTTGLVLVTGKFWPKIYALQLTESDAN